ncbi:MAG: Fe(2+) transporter permease subunit FeoB, partial [Leptolyngbyaceae cyanobacterium CRU_2_3]|nr:Fe(2+) transporter permease subunit FeoB [Leptolyngbyaceae cyanobacterium CRU_2_3]
MIGQIIGLVGNPNCGKTTLFNALTGANQRVGNWPGVTVERKAGKFNHEGQEITVVDLPGVYSLDAADSDTGLDEAVARDYLLSGEANVVINIVDASNLERNLYLTTQILEMQVPMIIALNMMDVAKEREVRINPDLLAERLGCPVVPMSATSGQGVAKLKACIHTQLDHPTRPAIAVTYPDAIETAITDLMPLLQKTSADRALNPRWTALKLLADESGNAPELQIADVAEQVEKQRQQIQTALDEDVDIIVADSRYGFIRNLTEGAAERFGAVKTTLSDKIDGVVLNRWMGIPIFLLIMYLMFTLSINVGGAFIDFIDGLFGTIFVDGVAQGMESLQAPGWLIGLLADGAGGGIQTAATFIPQIGMMFIFLSALEDSGYMSRAAFVMDRLMRLVGLPGKSFVPMIVGFGCNIPGIMATRTLENKRDRITTVMMNPFMSCSARLAVYTLFCAAFFPVGGQNVVMGLYLLGILAAIGTGIVLKNTILPGEVAPFVMELPPYHIPRLKSILFRAWERTMAFVKKAGKAIVIMVIILGFLNSVGTDGSFGKQDSTDSILSTMSRSITPVFTPMGISQENWPATVGLMSGVFAKEVMVGTMSALYGELAKEEASTNLAAAAPYSFWGGIASAFATIPANLAALPPTLLDPLGFSATQNAESAQQAAQENGAL